MSQANDGGQGQTSKLITFEDGVVTLAGEEVPGILRSLRVDTLSGMFRKVDDKANPQIYTVANRHLLARGVRQVVFSKFCSSENDRTDEIMVTLGFVEHNPPVVKTEKAQAKTPTSKELAEQAAEKAKQAAEPKEDELIITAE